MFFLRLRVGIDTSEFEHTALFPFLEIFLRTASLFNPSIPNIHLVLASFSNLILGVILLLLLLLRGRFLYGFSCVVLDQQWGDEWENRDEAQSEDLETWFSGSYKLPLL